MWIKSLLILLQYCFCFIFGVFFGQETHGILVSWPGMEPAHPALEGEILTTGPIGNALILFQLFVHISFCQWEALEEDRDRSRARRDSALAVPDVVTLTWLRVCRSRCLPAVLKSACWCPLLSARPLHV